ncbi:hypothetical protein ANO11243_055740 [Dothideomycetidae sp. 11243]|nr:hypothetical protein ANO11243_055740 [fungal sp. No.11243]
MTMYRSLFAAAALIASAAGHGMLTSPSPRLPGPLMVATCGQQAANQDTYGNIQALLQTAQNQPDYHPAECMAWLCKGYTYADNTAKLQHYTVGQVVPMAFDVRAPHTGVANVSIVNTATNQIIGQPLKSYASFASNQVGVQPDELSFSVTIPDVGTQCATPGACVIQHYWNAASIDQTYESCIDFVVGAGGAVGSSSSAAGSSSSSSAASASTATTSATSASTATTSSAAVTTSSATSVSSTSAVLATTQSMCSGTTTSYGATVTVTHDGKGCELIQWAVWSAQTIGFLSI